MFALAHLQLSRALLRTHTPAPGPRPFPYKVTLETTVCHGVPSKPESLPQGTLAPTTSGDL